MALPNFLCVGTMKGGTTTLHDLLKQHPDILLPPAQKELRFFDVDENYRKGLPWYEEFFRDRTSEKAVGEIAPTYGYREEAPERIARDLGRDVKLIFSLRHPVDRAYSHYVMNCMKQYETHAFDKAMAVESQRLGGAFPERLRFGYIDQGKYSTQIKRFLDYFPRENMLFLLFEEDLLRNRRTALQRVYSFLGVDDAEIDLDVWSYAARPASLRVFPLLSQLNRFKLINRLGKSRPVRAVKGLLTREVGSKLDRGVRRQLMERHFAAEVSELEPLIARDLTGWLSAG